MSGSSSPRHRSSTIRPAVAKLALRPASPTPTPTPTPTQHTARIRAHLAHLLPRHAAFAVTLTLHQLHNVPLVHGEFALKWHVKGVTSHSGTRILDKVKPRRSAPYDPPARASDTDNTSLFDAASVSDPHSAANSSAPSNDHLNHSIPAVIVSDSHPPPVERSWSIQSVSSASSISSTLHNPPAHPPRDTDALLPPANGDPRPPTKFHYSPAKGITPFVRLKDHSVVWEQTLNLVVQMSLARDNAELGDCLAKFVVMQRVVSGDPDAPRNPRLGAVYLNLAQYVDAGVITRRYLLRQSKTNATLRLTVHVEHTAGETCYVAPPLPKGEILSGVAGLLESSDIYRTRPRASDLYVHTSSDSSSDDAGAGLGSDTSSIVSGSGASNERNQSHTHPHRRTRGKHHRRPFDVAKLLTVNDPRGTEKLIEALFNPVPVTQPDRVTPFTYLVEVDGDADDGECGSYRVTAAQDEGTHPRKNGEADEDGSLYADSPDASADEGGGIGSDYHSLRSHPSFQSSLRNKRSNRSLVSKIGSAHDDGGKDTAITTGVHLLGGATERRTWWQKVLGSPNIG